jgi:hypothetical protein
MTLSCGKKHRKSTTVIVYDNKNLHITELEDTRPVFILYEVQSKMICISSPFCSIVRVPPLLWSCSNFFVSNGVYAWISSPTIYALLGPGLHARSGVSRVVLLKIWNTYAVPRYLYGLEIQAYTPLDTKKLEQLQRATSYRDICSVMQ